MANDSAAIRTLPAQGTAGRSIECMMLARAVRWHLEHRVLLNGHKAVVFR